MRRARIPGWTDPHRRDGRSFGGYMANWIAGHTDGSTAIVTHASLWALDQFGPTTDGAYWWAREMTPEMAEQNSPHRYAAEIRTPMLVIHGDKDYRVPIGEALRLWSELLTDPVLPGRRGRARTDSSTSRRRTTGCSARSTRRSGTKGMTAFLARHVLARTSNRRRRSQRPRTAPEPRDSSARLQRAGWRSSDDDGGAAAR